MVKKAAAAVPDAWDDDWENLADAEEDGGVRLSPQPAAPEEDPKASKEKLLQRHREENKKVWQSAYVLPRAGGHRLLTETQGIARALSLPRRARLCPAQD